MTREPSLAVAVDCVPLRPCDADAPHTQAVFALLAEIARQQTVVFLFLTQGTTHGQVSRFARPQDVLICVQNDPAHPLYLPISGEPLEHQLTPAPEDFLPRLGVDVLYCPFGAPAVSTGGVPVVTWIGDVLHRDYPHGLGAKQIAARESAVAQTLGAAALLQCGSRSVIERMMAHYQVPEEKLFYTYLPVPVNGEAGPAQVAAGAPDGERPFFFYPANLARQHNHETLLLAYRLYRENAGAGAWDLVLGAGPENRAGELQELAEALGIAPHLRFTDNLQALWPLAGALVFVSLHEGSGLALFEAMARGVPIISGGDFALREIAGDAACRVDARKPESIAQALLEVSRDAALRERLIRQGSERLGFFDLAMEARKLAEALADLPRREAGFPRKPKVLEAPCALATPTPATDALWTVEVRVDPQAPQALYSVYLDEAAFGSFAVPNEGEAAFRFQCRPLSRTLRVVVAGEPTAQAAIAEVFARGPQGESARLFQREEDCPR